MVKHFFGENGLTSTSANHVANLAKEYVATKKSILDNFTFLNAQTSAGGNSYTTQIATKRDVYDNIPNIVSDIQEATRLIAWLREGLKAKEEAQTLDIMDFKKWCAANNIEFPKAPTLGHIPTEDEIIATWDKEKYNSLFAHQTNASVVGELIHNSGGIVSARKAFTKTLTNPTVVEGSGRDLTVTEYYSLYSPEDVEKLFFDLQNLQRDEQAKYNRLRHEIDSAIENATIEVNAAYEKEYKAYKNDSESKCSEYNVYVAQEKKRIKDLKIIIPDSLQGIYQKVSKLGKE